MNVARRFIVKGTVQGVGFRYFAIRAARKAGVVGTVRNLEDGTVEAIAEGSQDALDEFRRALKRGPDYARVTDVEAAELQPSGRFSSFDVSF